MDAAGAGAPSAAERDAAFAAWMESFYQLDAGDAREVRA